MKKSIRVTCFLAFLIMGLSADAQKYKSTDDTIKLNKEYINVVNDIAELDAKLTIAKNNLPGYQSKAVNAGSDAQNAAANSSNQASKATNGEIDDAKKAKRKARKAYNEAKDLKTANKNLSDQENKITRLTLQINKKNQRLQELDLMRTAISEKLVIQAGT